MSLVMMGGSAVADRKAELFRNNERQSRKSQAFPISDSILSPYSLILSR
jgi:hypothetical protein